MWRRTGTVRACDVSFSARSLQAAFWTQSPQLAATAKNSSSFCVHVKSKTASFSQRDSIATLSGLAEARASRRIAHPSQTRILSAPITNRQQQRTAVQKMKMRLRMNTPPKMDVFLKSTNQLAVSILPPTGAALLDPRALVKRLVHWFKNMVSWHYIKTDFKKFGMKPKVAEFTEQIKVAYVSFCRARAAGDLAALHDTVNDDFLELFKTELSKRPSDIKILWELKDNHVDAKVNSVRYIKLETGKEYKFVQLNFALTSEQRVQVFKDGKRIGGSDNFETVTDYLVAERSLDDLRVAPHWRFLGRIDPEKHEEDAAVNEAMLHE